MKATTSRRAKQGQTGQDGWPRKVQPGRAIVMVYRRKTPTFTKKDGTTGGGNFGYMVANYADGDNRRFDCYKSEGDAIAAAESLAKRLDARDYVAASMTKDQAIEFANSVARLKPFGVTVDEATATIAECLKLLPDLAKVFEAVRFYVTRHRPTTAKSVADVVTELLKVKTARGASDRYRSDLKSRLERFAQDCNKDCCNVSSADIQAWLDGLKVDKQSLSPQSYKNYRTVLHGLFEFAVARGYAVDNPVVTVEKLKVRNGDVEVFTPVEIERLLESARAHFPAFLPCLAIGAFAGLRSAELERLEWEDIDQTARHIVVAASKSKTASRRIVPIADNLLEWLRTYANRQGKVWTGTHYELYDVQQAVAAATEVKADDEKGIKAQKPVTWKANGLRHSYASYRFTQTNDAGRVAGECGNSATVIHRHYRELVKPSQAERWFSIKPESPANVVPMLAGSQSRS